MVKVRIRYLALLALVLPVLGCMPTEETEQSVWVPYSYSAVFDEDGIQTGWVLKEFLLDVGPLAGEEADDGTVEIPLDIEVERREVPKNLDWVPPGHLEQGESVQEDEQ